MSKLTVDGVALAARDAVAKPQELFDAVAEKFGFDMKIAKYLVDVVGCESLSDLRTTFASAAQLHEKVISKIPDLTFPMRQAARLVQAWEATKDTTEIAMKRKREGEDLEDALLESTELKEIRANFYRRYKMHFPSQFAVADRLLSRLVKEVRTLQLTLVDLIKVSALSNQAMSEKRRRQLTANVFYEEKDDKPDNRMAETVEGYCLLLLTDLCWRSCHGRMCQP